MGGIVERFLDSLVVDFERWHDGVGCDLALLDSADEDERRAIEDVLVQRPVRDWRDVEALAALGTERCRRVLERVLREGEAELRGAVLDHAPELVTDEVRTVALAAALAEAAPFAGLSRTIDRVVEHHPPPVVDAVLRGVREREGEVAVHLAGLALFLHGRAETPFDMDQRPFLLRFASDDEAEREAAYRELCERIGRSPDVG